MLHVFEEPVLRLLGVPRLFQLPQRPDHAMGGIDGIGASAHFAHMHRHAPHLDLKPERADIGTHQHLLLGFRDQDRLRVIAPQIGHQGTVAGRFLFHDGLQMHPRGGDKSRPAQRVQREEDLRLPGLHVGAAAPVKPVALHMRLEGRMAPHVLRPGGHHIHMRLQDQRPPHLLPGMMRADHDLRRRMLGAVFARALMRLDRGAVHLEPLHLVAAPRQFCGDKFDHLLLPAAGGGKAHQSLGKFDLVRKPLLDRGCDGRFHLLRHAHLLGPAADP